ncbi:MAG TPA: mandelate racemase/muconate lactonizing enzyme family protein [Terriglobia bacterium]|jgi:L-alanine-DL-glutamate epimerase-like enolase superfamily enzyme|nr:mandelate racemase/muconate lactonizing enzyme family protein [Terriglobia bacterium]
MKIKSVTAHPLQYPEPHDHNNIRYITLARVEAGDGTVGWGECISQFPESSLAVKTVIELGYQPLLVGEDARDVERLWHKLLGRIWWYGPQGIAGFAVSAVDMALWDLKGKLMGVPVVDLLGGALHEQVRAMASIHFDMEDLDWTLKEFQWFREQGYEIAKGGWGKSPSAVFGLDRKRDLELVRRVRDVIGDDIDLVVDVLGARVKWDVPTAIQRIRSFEPYRLKWIEEPLPPHDLAGHARLRSAVGTNIGTGEQEWNVEGYRRLIRSGGVDIVQMDPGRCLGITACRHAIKLIEAENLHFTMHTWSSALNTAASVHLLAASTHGVTMDFKPHESPMQHELVSDPWVQTQGYLAVRKTPGLGVTVREDVVKKYEFSV